MNLTDTEYPYFQALLFSEILGICIAMLVVCIACYLILKVRQFHQNVIGLIGNMALIFFVLVICRLIQIGATSLNSRLDAWNYVNSDFTYYLEYTKSISLNAYSFLIPFLGIERTLATVLLKTYEDFKNPFYLVGTNILPWILGFAMTFIIANGFFNIFIWISIIAFILLSSLIWLLILHFINQYRYNNREVFKYNLKEKFQLSENIRFLKIIKWCTVAIIIGDSLVIIVFIGFITSERYHYFRLVLFNYSILFNGIALPIVTIFTNRIWKRELIRMLRKLKTKISPWKREEKEVINPRFHAPHLLTLRGRPMVFNVEEEKELYFRYLQTRL